MPFQPVPRSIKLAVEHQLYGQQVVNTFYVQKATEVPITPLEVEDITRSQGAQWVATVLPLLGPGLQLIRVVGTALDVESGAQFVSTDDSGNIGEAFGGVALPNSAAFCLTLSTGLSGRSFRGRTYLAGLLSSMTEAPNVISSITAEELKDQMIAFVERPNVLTEGLFRTSVVSRFAGGAMRPVGVPVVITSVGYSDRVIDSQRRRLPGRGQ